MWLIPFPGSAVNSRQIKSRLYKSEVIGISDVEGVTPTFSELHYQDSAKVKEFSKDHKSNLYL
jgi:hypothetical protein